MKSLSNTLQSLIYRHTLSLFCLIYRCYSGCRSLKQSSLVHLQVSSFSSSHNLLYSPLDPTLSFPIFLPQYIGLLEFQLLVRSCIIRTLTVYNSTGLGGQGNVTSTRSSSSSNRYNKYIYENTAYNSLNILHLKIELNQKMIVNNFDHNF